MANGFYISDSEKSEDIQSLLRSSDYIEGSEFTGIDFSDFPLDEYSFEECRFTGCTFSNMSLANASFTDTAFEQCEFVVIGIDNLALKKVSFKGCRLMGLHFSQCNKFGFSIEMEECYVANCIFSDVPLKKTAFYNNTIRECDFSFCDMQKAMFNRSTFEQVTFSSCNLEEADFTECSGYRIDPFNNKLKKARFNLPEAESFLSFLEIRIE